MVASSSSASDGKRCKPVACCEPIERRRRPTWTGRGSVVRQRVQVSAGLSQDGDEPVFAQLGELPNASEAVLVQLAGGHGSDTPQVLDGKRVQEAEFVVGRHH